MKALSYTRNGALHFLAVWRFRFSFCVAADTVAERAAKKARSLMSLADRMASPEYRSLSLADRMASPEWQESIVVQRAYHEARRIVATRHFTALNAYHAAHGCD